MRRKLFLSALGLITLVFILNWRFHMIERLLYPRQFNYITVRGTEFYLHGEPFRFVGANTRLVHGQKERRMVREALANAASDGLRVIRQWAVGEAADSANAVHAPVSDYYFQVGPNGWQEQSLVHFDSLLAIAAEFDLKVIVTLFNNWSDYGGMPMYAYWRGLQDGPRDMTAHDQFYSDSTINVWSRNWIEKIVGRRNTVTGRLYRDDPTIFSWELVNEQRAALDQAAASRRWTGRMAALIRELDPHHLIGTSLSMSDNAIDRQIFIDHFEAPELDYVDVHLYPSDRWWRNLVIDKDRLGELLDDYTQIAHYALKKPLLIGEVGFSRRDEPFGGSRSGAFATLLSRSLDNAINGVVVWSYSDPDWDDAHEIHWRAEEHAPVCSVLAEYGVLFGAAAGRPAVNPDIGAAFGSSSRVRPRELRFSAPPPEPRRTGPVTLEYQFLPQNFGRASWTNFGYWDGDTAGFAAIYGKDAGYFAFEFHVDDTIAVRRISFKARLSSTFPDIPGADTLGSTQAAVAIDSFQIGSVDVLPVRSFGTVHELRVARDRGRPLLMLDPGPHWLTFSVEHAAPIPIGLSILGEANTPALAEDEQFIELEMRVADAARESGEPASKSTTQQKE